MINMFTSLVALSVIGIAVLGSTSSEHKEEQHKVDKYSKEWFRDELSIRHYSDWDCHDIAWQMRDNWIRDDFERLLRNGYSVEYAIDELVSKNVIKL